MPKWAKPYRQAHLVNLFLRSGGFCVFSEWPCSCPQLHHYEPFSEALIADWKAEDRAQDLAEWQAEQRALHGLGERGRTKGEFNAIAKEIWFAQQPLHYIEGLGISGLTFRPFAKVRLASSYVVLFVDIADVLKGESKNKRRKAIRYGKPLPQEIQREIALECSKAIRHYRR